MHILGRVIFGFLVGFVTFTTNDLLFDGRGDKMTLMLLAVAVTYLVDIESHLEEKP